MGWPFFFQMGWFNHQLVLYHILHHFMTSFPKQVLHRCRCQVSQLSAESLALLKVELRDFRYEVPGWWLKVGNSGNLPPNWPKMVESWKLKSGNLPQRYRLNWRGSIFHHQRWVWKKNRLLSFIYPLAVPEKKETPKQRSACLIIFEILWVENFRQIRSYHFCPVVEHEIYQWAFDQGPRIHRWYNIYIYMCTFIWRYICIYIYIFIYTWMLPPTLNNFK